MLKISQLFLISLLIFSKVVNATNIHLQIEGLSWTFKNIRTQLLSTIKDNEVTSDKNFRAYVDNSIRKSLRAIGYYEPTINFNLRSSNKDGHQILVAHVDPGEPIRIKRINIILRGEAQNDRDYLNLLNKCPTLNTILNHGDYENFKKSLIRIAMKKGYFDSQFNKNQLGIIISKHQAFWNIDYDSGKRYRFGNITFEGSQILDEYLKNLIPFKKGDYYDSKKIAELNRRLSATGWFNSVVIAPNINNSFKRKTFPMHGIISQRAKNSIEIGIGYSTDLGPHIKSSWKKPWINSFGHSLNTSASISIPEQQIYFSYKTPLKKNPLEQYYILQSGFKRTNLNNTKVDSATLVISRYWNLFNGWQQAINLRWNFDHFTQANASKMNTMLFYPGIIISRTRLHNGLMPIWGDFHRYSIDYSNNFLGSDVNFIIIQAQNAWVRTLRNRHCFTIRSNFGWIETKYFNNIPPDLRFFAGGDRNIRGYKYKSISPKDNNGKLIGAAKLATGSLEYKYNISGKWWNVIFIDSGEAVNTIYFNELKTGIGIGICWVSPFGPIKFDFAMPLSKREERNLQFYIGLGPEL